MPGIFIAAGYDGLRLVSENGVEWREAAAGKEGEVFRSGCVGNGRVVLTGTFGGKNLFAVSTDGIEWQTGLHDAKYSNYMRGVAWGAGRFVCVGGQAEVLTDKSAMVFLSQDGAAWEEPKVIGGKTVLRRLVYAKDQFVGVGDRGRRSRSKDGVVWENLEKPRAVDTLVDVAFGAGRYVGVGLHGLRMSSEDGLDWGHRFTGEEGEHINSIIWTGDRFVAVGQGATFISPDGVTWKSEPNENAPLSATYGAGVFVGSHWKGRLLTSQDGIRWREAQRVPHHIECLLFKPA